VSARTSLVEERSPRHADAASHRRRGVVVVVVVVVV
jgi:hypothetical protein